METINLEAKQRLAAGESPKGVFDLCFNHHDGFSVVKLNEKWNFIDRSYNILSDTWFDYCWDFQDGFARVKLNEKWNFINREGNYLSDTWFDWCGCFYEWFDWCEDFRDWFAQVGLNGIDYLLRKDGVLCDYNTKEPVKPEK